MSAPLLEAEGLAYTYDDDDWTLTGCGLSLSAGELACLIGPNGSGKSTLLRLCAGTLPPKDGHVRLLGKPLSALKRAEIARALSYLPQEVRPDFDLTVEELAGMGRFAHSGFFEGSSGRDLEARDRALRETGLWDKRRRRLSALSGGERRRAFLASCLAQEPRVLLLDEPTAALDPHHSSAFFRLLRKLAEGGLAVLAVTHDLNLASLFSQRLLLLENGRLTATGTPAAVLGRENLARLYGAEVISTTHPQTGTPVVLPGV